MTENLPTDSTPLMDGLRAMHELFTSYVKAGFTERQAAILVIEMTRQQQPGQES